ncbi:MAG: alpha/beta hydrolase [Armatimonadetes bacterium]|nr:alpha/beta hydrolase [Armatimonadota bacterium]
MTFALLAICAVHLAPTIKEELDVTYNKVAGKELKMDIFQPEAKPVAMRPAIIVIHGGAWMAGDRKDMHALAREFAKKGFFAASVQYRLAPMFKYPTMIDDVQTAVRFLRANAGKYSLDKNRFAATGASAGGHLSLLLGFTDTRDPKPTAFPKESSKVQVVLNIFGPTDMRRDFPSSLDPLYFALLGKKRSEAAREIELASPLYYVNSSVAPVFTIHGESDPLVPVIQAKILDEALAKVKVDHKTVLIPNMGHALPIERKEVLDALTQGIQFVCDKLNVKS